MVISWQATVPEETHRTLRLSWKEGKRPKDMPQDAIKVPIIAKTEGHLWYCYYEHGQFLPEALKQKWTNFNRLFKAVSEYYAMKDIDVKEE